MTINQLAEEIASKLKETSCPAKTAENLQSLLGTTQAPAAVVDLKSRGRESKSIKEQRAKSVRAAPKTITGATPVLSPAEKVVVATTSVNHALKFFTEAAKRDGNDNRASRSLRNVSPNKCTTPRSTNENPSETGSVPFKARGTHHLESLGASAIVAFDFLLSNYDLSLIKTTQELCEIEAGICALATKAIVLHLYDLTLKLLQTSRAVLARFNASAKPSISARLPHSRLKVSPKPLLQPDKNHYAQLFSVKIHDNNKQHILMFVEHDMLVLRMAAMFPRRALSEQIKERFVDDTIDSPLDMILKNLANFANLGVVVKRLESMSQLLLMISSQVLGSIDGTKIIQDEGELIYGLQVVALMVRLRAISLVDHVDNETREIIRLFSKYSEAYSSTTTIAPAACYKIVEAAFHRLEKCATVSRFDSETTANGSTLRKVHWHFYDMSKKANLIDQVARWSDMLMVQERSSQVPEAESAAISCVMAATQLRRFGSEHNDAMVKTIVIVLQQATELFSHNLTGQYNDLERLLQEGLGLRNECYKLFANRQDANPVVSELRLLCVPLFSSFIEFLRRLDALTQKLSGVARDKPTSIVTAAKLDQIKEDTAEITFYCVFGMVDSNLLSWDILDLALQRCLAISPTNDWKPAKQQVAKKVLNLRISDLYWVYYIRHKEESEALGNTCIQSLRRSCQVLSNVSIEQQKIGALDAKLYKLARALYTIRAYAEARTTLGLSIGIASRDGIIKSLADVSASRPLSRMSKEIGDNNSLIRSLSLNLEISLTEAASNELMLTLYHDPDLAINEQSLLLELQLDLLEKMPMSLKHSELGIATHQQILSLLSHIYTRELYPFHSRRISLYYLHAHMERRYKVDAKIVETALLCAQDRSWISECHDCGLNKYHRGLDAALCIAATLASSDNHLELLRSAAKSWEDILDTGGSAADTIENDDVWISQIRSGYEASRIRGTSDLCVRLAQILLQALELCQKDVEHQAQALLLLGNSYFDQGNCREAGLCFSKAVRCGQGLPETHEFHVERLLAYGDYLLSLGSLDKCEGVLAHASTVLRSSQLNNGHTMYNKMANVRYAKLLSILSMLSLKRGRSYDTTLFARSAVQILKRAWSYSNLSCPSRPIHDENHDNVVTDLARNVINMSISERNAENRTITADSSSWPLASALISALLTLSDILSESGIYQHALHYAEEARKIAEATSASTSLLQYYLARSTIAYVATDMDKAEQYLHEGSRYCEASDTGLHAIKYYLTLSRTQSFLGKQDLAMANIAKATVMLQAYQTLCPVTKETSDHSIVLHAQKTQVKSRSKNQRTVIHKSPQQFHASLPVSSKIAEEQWQVMRTRIDCARRQNDVKAIHDIIHTADDLCTSAKTTAWLQRTKIEWILHEAAQESVTDPTLSLLLEATLALPAAIRRGTLLTSTASDGSTTSSPLRSSPKKTFLRSKKMKPGSMVTFLSDLHEILDDMIEQPGAFTKRCSLLDVRRTCLQIAGASALLFSLPPIAGRRSYHAYETSTFLELPKTTARSLERQFTQISKVKKVKNTLPAWPDIAETTNSQRTSISDALSEITSILPETWIAVSMTVSEDRKHLFLTRYRSAETPWIIRVPLVRSSAHDQEEESFSLDDAKAEMLEIIRRSDSTAHMARSNPDSMNSESARKRWWDERESLDHRLRDLLHNIEHMWLGGFRGILSTHQRQDSLLAQFAESFERMLDDLLPSRQRSGRRTTVDPVKLDPRVLELFTGLKTTNDTADIGEAIGDLLYFVVDVLHLNGEVNAYDEIDFDSMTIKTQDMLRTYQEAASAQLLSEPPKHIVLVLDKNLHCYPWESMPCLAGESVSRLPSLDCLSRRVLEMRSQLSYEKLRPRYYADRSEGTYILNPSGDLTSTQLRFEEPLQALRYCANMNWSSYVNEAPSEANFARALSGQEANANTYERKSPVTVYIGHGSGAQYIHPSAIKRLDNCGTALLFGCSSARLTEAGDYEPYGTPYTYMAAGAPAMLGCLWDVTDGDLDKCAMRVLENWGLLAPGTSTVAAANQMKGKRKVRSCKQTNCSPATEKLEMSLSEAIAKSRDECYLKYLNGAAMVVYGVPVYLSKT